MIYHLNELYCPSSILEARDVKLCKKLQSISHTGTKFLGCDGDLHYVLVEDHMVPTQFISKLETFFLMHFLESLYVVPLDELPFTIDHDLYVSQCIP